MTAPTVEQIAKLPRWAQEHIRDLTRQREAAIGQLTQFTDEQTPSPIYIDEWASTGESKGPTPRKRYIQSDQVRFEYAGLRLEVSIKSDNIRLRWSTQGIPNDVAFIPESFCQARLTTKENMR